MNKVFFWIWLSDRLDFGFVCMWQQHAEKSSKAWKGKELPPKTLSFTIQSSFPSIHFFFSFRQVFFFSLPATRKKKFDFSARRGWADGGGGESRKGKNGLSFFPTETNTFIYLVKARKSFQTFKQEIAKKINSSSSSSDSSPNFFFEENLEPLLTWAIARWRG